MQETSERQRNLHRDLFDRIEKAIAGVPDIYVGTVTARFGGKVEASNLRPATEEEVRVAKECYAETNECGCAGDT